MYKYHRIFILFIAILTGLTACRVGRDYQRPEVELPEELGREASADTSVAGMAWNDFFTDRGLQELIAQALEGNYDMQRAVKQIETARSYLKEAGAAWQPEVILEATGSTSYPSKNSLNGVSLESFIGTNHVEDYNLQAGLSWEIDVWGRIRRQKEAARAAYLETYEAARAVRTELVASIANSYYNLLMLDEQLEIARKNIALSDTVVQMMKLQKSAGEVTELAVQQSIAQKQTAELLVPQLEQAVSIQENALRILTGRLPDTVNRDVALYSYPMWESLPTGLPAELLNRRPDVRAAELALVAANAGVGVAQANRYPALSITASGGLNAFEASEWFKTPASLFGMVGGGIAQPVLQRRRLKTAYEVAQTERETAVIDFRQSVLNAVGEVSDALVKLDKLESQQSIVEGQVNTLETAISQSRMLFNSGMASYLEVITAQERSLEAELTLADLTRQRLDAAVELYRALGGG